MKNLIVISAVLLSLMLTSCKNSGETSEKGEEATPKLMDSKYVLYSGEYFYSSDGAVLKGNSFIYAVTLDDMAEELGKMIEPIKKEEYDMVPVMVKGVVKRNPALDEGKQVWEQIITIKEIVSIGNTPVEADIKIEESKS